MVWGVFVNLGGSGRVCIYMKGMGMGVSRGREGCGVMSLREVWCVVGRVRESGSACSRLIAHFGTVFYHLLEKG